MAPTQTEKDIHKRDVALAKAALGQLDRNKGQSDENEIDARKFDALKWREDLNRATKRRRIEDDNEDEMNKKKKQAVPDPPTRDDEEAEEDTVVIEGTVNLDLEKELPQRKVSDVSTPREHLAEGVCKYFRIFEMLNPSKRCI